MSEIVATAERGPSGLRAAMRRVRPVGIYVAVVVAAGIAALVRLASVDGIGWVRRDPDTLVLLGVAGFLAELKPLKVPRGSETEDVSLSTTFSAVILIGW